jgi:hypothetical protein
VKSGDKDAEEFGLHGLPLTPSAAMKAVRINFAAIALTMIGNKEKTIGELWGMFW